MISVEASMQDPQLRWVEISTTALSAAIRSPGQTLFQLPCGSFQEFGKPFLLLAREQAQDIRGNLLPGRTIDPEPEPVEISRTE